MTRFKCLDSISKAAWSPAVLTFVLIFKIAVLASNHAVALTPFSCSNGEFYYATYSGSSFTLRAIDPSNGFASNSLYSGSGRLNAIGFNPNDDFIYGIIATGGSLTSPGFRRLYRFGSNGYELVSAPTVGGGSIASGTFLRRNVSGVDGYYYAYIDEVIVGFFNIRPVLRIYDVATQVQVAAVTLSNTVPADDILDMIFNPVDGFLYFLTNGAIYSIDQYSGSVNLVVTSPSSPTLNNLFSNADGRLFSVYPDSTLREIILATGGTVTIRPETYLPNADGAACMNARVPLSNEVFLNIRGQSTAADGVAEFNVSNGFGSASLAVTASFTETGSRPIGVAQPTTVSVTPPTGQSIQSYQCERLNGGSPGPVAGTTFDVGTMSLVLPASAASGGASLRCDFVFETSSNFPTLTVSTETLGGFGVFIYNGGASANGFPANYTNETTSGANPITGSAVTLTSSNTLTEIEQAAPPGWTLTSARCTDQNNPTGPVIGTLVGSILTIPGASVQPGADLLCLFTNTYTGFVLSGRVIIDNGVGGGVPYDAAQNGSEQGLAGISLSLTDCTSITPFATAVSGGGGRFSLQIPAGPATGSNVCVIRGNLPNAYVGVSSNAGDLDGLSATGNTGTDPYDRISSDPDGTGSAPSAFTAGTNYPGIVFGVVPVPEFVVDRTASVVPGQVVDLGHRYIPSTTAEIGFELDSLSAIPSLSSFATALWTDLDCDGALQLSGATLDQQIDPSTRFSVTADGPDFCILVRSSVSSSAPDGAALSYDIRAITELTPPSSAPVIGTDAVIDPFLNRDTVTVTGGGAIVLTKRVCNQTQRGTCGSGDFGFTSDGQPGDVLVYSLTFENLSSDSVTDVEIRDTTPLYTRLAAPSPAVVTAPPGMTCSASGPGNGNEGDILWSCTGDMSPGARGEAVFTVQINP